ncbi:MAG: HIT family protein [Desulfococcaceae bacterium]
MTDCIFCKIIKKQIPSFRVYEDDRVYAFEDINPINRGHTLIIPKNHAENIWEMSDEDMLAIHRAAKKISHAIKEALKPDGLVCLQLNGRTVNQVVMHYHYHLIPRSADEPEMAMTNWVLKPGNMDEIRQTAEKIAAAIR